MADIWKDYINDDTELTAYHWNNMWQEYDTSSTGYMMANAGYKGPIQIPIQTGKRPEVNGKQSYICPNSESRKVILAPATHHYFDHAIVAEPNSRGLMWATRFSDLWKAFSFRPMDMNANGLYRQDLNDNNGSQTKFSYAGDKIKSGCIDNQDGKDFKCTEENF